jgi:branched-chain amino acid transport system permease protein
VVLAAAGSLAFGFVLERLVLRVLLRRSHLDQVLATYGLILLLEEAARTIWGRAPVSVTLPDALGGTVRLADGLNYPVYRLVLLGAGLAVALLLWLAIEHTRFGMRLRAGASNAAILSALGVNTDRLFALVLAMGAMLAGFAGAMAAPLVSVEPGMGGSVLILAFVVIVLGGTGSMRGAFLGALLVGLTDTLGRTLLADLLHSALGASAARQAGPALASMLIYLLMAVVLAFRPQGLLPNTGRA